MKKSLSRIASILLTLCLLLSLSACTTTTAVYDENGEVILQTPPEPTDKLVVYVPKLNPEYMVSDSESIVYSGIISTAKREFERLYPEVELTLVYQEGTNDEYWDTLQTEFMAGKGTDVILFQEQDFADLSKTMDANLFYNIDNFIAADEDFNVEDYHPSLFNGGMYKGQRFYIPLNGAALVMLTDRNRCAEAGMTFTSDTPTFEEWSEQFVAFLESGGEGKPLYSHTDQYLHTFLQHSGMTFLDYENMTNNLRTDGFRAYMEFYSKSRDVLAQMETEQYDFYMNNSHASCSQMLNTGNIRFLIAGQIDVGRIECCNYGIPEGDELVMPFPTLEGQPLVIESGVCTGIRNSSPNKANAYRFLKVLLSDKGQEAYSYWQYNSYWTPVKLSQIASQINITMRSVGGSLYDVHHTQEELDAFYENYISLEYRRQNAPAVTEIVYREMQPWMEGETSFEACVDELENTLELYLYE